MHTARPNAFAQRQSLAGPSIRLGLVARVRREIEEGIYDSPEKLEIALQRLLGAVADGGDDEPRR